MNNLAVAHGGQNGCCLMFTVQQAGRPSSIPPTLLRHRFLPYLQRLRGCTLHWDLSMLAKAEGRREGSCWVVHSALLCRIWSGLLKEGFHFIWTAEVSSWGTLSLPPSDQISGSLQFLTDCGCILFISGGKSDTPQMILLQKTDFLNDASHQE